MQRIRTKVPRRIPVEKEIIEVEEEIIPAETIVSTQTSDPKSCTKRNKFVVSLQNKIVLICFRSRLCSQHWDWLLLLAQQLQDIFWDKELNPKLVCYESIDTF